MTGSYMYNNLKRFKDDFCRRTEDATDNEVAGNGGFQKKNSSLGSFSIEQNSRAYQHPDTRLDKLLFQIP